MKILVLLKKLQHHRFNFLDFFKKFLVSIDKFSDSNNIFSNLSIFSINIYFVSFKLLLISSILSTSYFSLQIPFNSSFYLLFYRITFFEMNQ